MTIIGILIILAVVLWIVAVARLSAQRGRYSSYWAQQGTAEVKSDELVYVALGDSAAQGIGASQPEKSYAGRIAANLAASSGRKVHIINFSVSGAKTADLIRDQLPAFKSLDVPDDAVITLEIGANNMGPDYDAKTFRSDMNQILDALPPQTIVADIPYFGAGLKRSREPTVEQANKIMHEVIVSHHMRQAHLFDQTKNFGTWRDFAADRFHPNDRGYANWSKAFTAVLDKN